VAMRRILTPPNPWYHNIKDQDSLDKFPVGFVHNGQLGTYVSRIKLKEGALDVCLRPTRRRDSLKQRLLIL
jgi:hypothetical protein